MGLNDASRTTVRLTRKYAEAIDGVDLSQNQVGDVLTVSPRDADLLVAEGWAAPCEQIRTQESQEADRSERSRKEEPQQYAPQPAPAQGPGHDQYGTATHDAGDQYATPAAAAPDQYAASASAASDQRVECPSADSLSPTVLDS